MEQPTALLHREQKKQKRLNVKEPIEWNRFDVCWKGHESNGLQIL